MTEDEAREKWCPDARYAGQDDDGGANRWKQNLTADEPHALNPIPCRCIASQCMAWRWQNLTRHYPWGSVNVGGSNDPRKGYCGRAGKP